MTPQELKNSILQLAIQGKLVEQRPEEGTAAELYKQIQAEKQALVKAGKIKKEKPLPEIAEDEKPFDIPENWVWIRLRQLVFNRGQETPVETFSYIDIGSIDNKSQRLNPVETLIEPENAPSRARKLVELGDIIYSTVRPYLHNMCIIDRSFSHKPIASTGFAAMACYNGLYNKYLFYYLLSPAFDSYANDTENSKGVAYPAINDDRLYRAIVPLPPLAEQERIVAKIEELLPLIDRYEQAWTRLEDFNKRFPGDMQKSLLQMAIQGKLVEQRPEEGTGEELAKALLLKKRELLQSGQILRKAETKPFLTQEELNDISIPDTWCWVQLSGVSLIQEGAGIRKWQYKNDGTQILCVTNILDGSIDLEKKKLYISTEEYLEKYQHLTPQTGDIVSSCSGGSWGKTAVFNCHDTMMLNTSTLRMRFFGDLASNKYLYYLTKSVFFKKQLERQLAGMQPNFGYAHYSRIMLPLPPLAEQKRIVARLEELLPLCERLK